ncbi:hypothetical protein BH11MYX4_BH11MYX4_68230 [soil metagenome]
MQNLSLLTLIVLAAGAAASASCANPVHSDAVAALGDEAPGERPGSTHRAGQPCLVCHGGDGPGPDFAIGGTIYAKRNGGQARPGVTVSLTDATGSTKTPVSNEVGNFYLTKQEWSPSYPVFVSLLYTDPITKKVVSKDMISRIGGNGGCGFCHHGPDNETFHMPPVFLSE